MFRHCPPLHTCITDLRIHNVHFKDIELVSTVIPSHLLQFRTTYQLLHFTLVNIGTNLPRFVYFEPRVANAPVSTDHVFAGTVLTDVGVLGALVDVVTVEGGPRTVRTKSVKVGSARHWTGLAISTPTHRFAGNNGTAAATRSGYCGRRRVEAKTVAVLLVTQVASGVQT